MECDTKRDTTKINVSNVSDGRGAENMNVFHFANMCTLMLSLMVTLLYKQQLLYPPLSVKLCLSLCQE